MAPPAEPYINIQTAITMGTIVVGEGFSWYNSGSINCTVSNVGGWCTSSSYGPIAGGQSAPATVSSSITPGSNYSYSSPCCEVGSPVVHVHGTRPGPANDAKKHKRKK